MDLRWGTNPCIEGEGSRVLHAIDADKNDGNPFAVCGGVLINVGQDLVKFGESRVGKCPKCFKRTRHMLQRAKKQRQQRERR